MTPNSCIFHATFHRILYQKVHCGCLLQWIPWTVTEKRESVRDENKSTESSAKLQLNFWRFCLIDKILPWLSDMLSQRHACLQTKLRAWIYFCDRFDCRHALPSILVMNIAWWFNSTCAAANIYCTCRAFLPSAINLPFWLLAFCSYSCFPQQICGELNSQQVSVATHMHKHHVWKTIFDHGFVHIY